MSSQVLIVGAGPTGLVLAIVLAKQGIPFRIIDKKSGPEPTARAMTIHARTLEFYDQLGIAEQLMKQGKIIKQVQMYHNHQFVAKAVTEEMGRGLSPYPYMVSLSQDEHEMILIEHLKSKGIHIEWNTELISFQENKDVVDVSTIQNGRMEKQSFSYLCGCDGSHSKVRKGMNVKFKGITYPVTFFIADVKLSDEIENLSIHFYNHDVCFVHPLRNSGSVRIIGAIPEPLNTTGEDMDVPPVIAYMKKYTNWKISEVTNYSTYKVHYRVSEHFRQGRVFILGDAAHIHSPAGGQGMNTGIGDAMNLGWKLSAVLKGKANSQLLDTYETERMAFAHSLEATTESFFKLLISKRLLHPFVLKYILPIAVLPILKSTFLKRTVYSLLSQTKIHYRKSILSSGHSGSIRGGDRLPWINIDEGDNYQYLTSVDWQLHIYGQATSEVRKCAELLSIPLHEFTWTKQMDSAGIKQNALFLIRPDGYIALASRHQDAQKIIHFVRRFQIM